MNTNRPLPDQHVALRDARDFIHSSTLARRALECDWPKFAIFLSDLLERIHRLAVSCHLPEFTDHGLPHLSSLVDRISQWGLPDDSNDQFLHHCLTPDEAAILLTATLIHDVGMLSQNPIDLPDSAVDSDRQGLWADTASWVRHTHVKRLPKLIRRLLVDTGHQQLLDSENFRVAVDVAMAHQLWPWEWSGAWQDNSRNRGLAAVVAVSDLLDEDAARCDTVTLLQHREGDELNRAHWLRHSLTFERILVSEGRIHIDMRKPPNCDDASVLRPVYSALRNHFRLVHLYEPDLRNLGAGITNIGLYPATGTPKDEEPMLSNWQRIPGFPTEAALAFQLLRTFMPIALKENDKLDATTLQHIRKASLEDVDTTPLHYAIGVVEPRIQVEQTFHAIVGSSQQ